MAFNRIIELQAGPNGTGLLISQLDIDFRIEKTSDLASNSASFIIYNAKESTRKETLKKGNNIIFKTGYADESVGVLFVGNITTSTSEKPGNTWITKIKASSIVSKDKSLSVIPVSLSYAPNISISKPLKILGQLGDLIISGITNIENIKMTNGWVYAGTFGGALRYIKSILDSNKIGMYIDNNEIVIYKIGEASRYKTVLLTYTGGLLNIKDITKTDEKKKRVEFTTLMIPQIRVNGVVTFKNTSNDGSYIVDKFIAEGNNYGGRFDIKGEATV